MSRRRAMVWATSPGPGDRCMSTSTHAAPAAADALGVEPVPVQVRFGPRATLSHFRRPLGDLASTQLPAAVRSASAGVDLVHLDRSVTTWLADPRYRPTVLSLHYRARLD